MHLVSTPTPGCQSGLLYLSSFMDHPFSFPWNWCPSLLLSSILIQSPWRLPNPRLATTKFYCPSSCQTFQNKPPNEYPTTDQLFHPHPLCLAACGWIYLWCVPITAHVPRLFTGALPPNHPYPQKEQTLIKQHHESIIQHSYSGFLVREDMILQL